MKMTLPSIKTVFVFISIFIYAIAFLLIFKLTGTVVGMLAIFPVLLIAWFWGIWEGLTAGLLSLPLNMVLYWMIGHAGWNEFVQAGIPSAAASVILGMMVGRMHNLHEELKLELVERKKAEESLKEANESLKSLDRMKSNFLSNISHELKTPLSMIKGFASTMLHEKEMDATNRQEFLRIIDEESDRLTKLVNRLMNLTRLEAGKIKLNIKEIDLVAAVNKVIESYRTQLLISGLALETSLPPDLRINADEHNLKEALSHLIDNAIKYTFKYGKIGISIEDKGKEALVSVSDTGCGIPREELPHIFERFYKVENPAEKVGGIGMGLALVKNIIEAHGGGITVESELRKGTKFTLSLPKRRNG